MPGGTSFRQTEEKQSSFVIDLMLWSPKMDLIAVTAVTGEVFPVYEPFVLSQPPGFIARHVVQ